MSRLPPRIRAHEIWRIPEAFLEQVQDDATLLSIHDMELAGIDIISDGEVRRESYSNRFATALYPGMRFTAATSVLKSSPTFA
jgi:5-methyltetrahydropteroyltriglutamate--homocysteine methyltransferase